jgi:predicted short-subunit dehydrogenase-like oxidoreductase (DUF2520 family)
MRSGAETDLPAVGLAGAGKVGLVLAGALRRAGHRIAAVWDSHEPAQDRAEQSFPSIQRVGIASDLALHAGLVIVAVPDDVLGDVIENLAAGPEPWQGVTVVHVSGRYGSQVLQPLADRGAVTGAMHPAMAFAGDVTTELERLSGACFAVTAGPEDSPRIRRMVRRMGGGWWVLCPFPRSRCRAGPPSAPRAGPRGRGPRRATAAHTAHHDVSR